MTTAIGFKFEKAVGVLMGEFAKVGRQKKPTIFHSIRVGSILFHHGLSEEICIAGLFHDLLEDTEVTFNILEKKYGKIIAEIVQLNSKDDNLSNEAFKVEMVQKCAEYSQEALIVKLVDVYDNFIYYKRGNNQSEIERCRVFAHLIRKYKKTNFDHEIFTLLDKIIH